MPKIWVSFCCERNDSRSRSCYVLRLSIRDADRRIDKQPLRSAISRGLFLKIRHKLGSLSRFEVIVVLDDFPRILVKSRSGLLMPIAIELDDREISELSTIGGQRELLGP